MWMQRLANWQRRAVRLTRKCCAISLGCALVVAGNRALASDGFTYTKVSDFAATISPESICDFALNDNGDVAYVGQQPTTVNGLPGTLYQVHLWNSTGSNQVVFSATILQNSATGQDLYTAPGTPYCGGFGGGSVGMAININRLIAIEAWIPDANGLFLGYGELYVDPTTSPATVTAVLMPFVSNSGTGLNSSGALGVVTLQNQIRVAGSVSPAGVSLIPIPPTLSDSWNTAGPGIQYGQAAINDSGLVSVMLESPASGGFVVLDVPAGSSGNSVTTPLVASASAPNGRIGLD
jgi:hypothetical protein